MPCGSNDDLPPSVRDHLPPHARDIFREALNHAWQSHASDEATAFRTWSAVKRGYRRRDEVWVRRDA